jgi:chromate transport protein ChrA
MNKFLPLLLTLSGLASLVVFRFSGWPLMAEVGNVLIAAGIVGWILTRLQSLRKPRQ